MVDDPFLELDRQYLISKIVFALNNNGLITEIETIDIDAYSRKASKQKETSKGTKSAN